MALEGGWLIPYMTQNFSSVQYGIAPVPVAPSGKQGDLIYTNAWSAYSKTAHPYAAWQLIQYMTGKDVQANQLHAGFALPTLKSLANDPYFTQNPGFKVMFDAANYGYADNYGPQDTNIKTEISNAVEQVMLGKADAKAALNNASDKINNDLQG
ncbi:MAG TPA: extracellular solute-binding protein, partial [Ktedonobacteraceae bacterium]|jgi:multiple sugar transport system substrate-binding protein